MKIVVNASVWTYMSDFTDSPLILEEMWTKPSKLISRWVFQLKYPDVPLDDHWLSFCPHEVPIANPHPMITDIQLPNITASHHTYENSRYTSFGTKNSGVFLKWRQENFPTPPSHIARSPSSHIHIHIQSLPCDQCLNFTVHDQSQKICEPTHAVKTSSPGSTDPRVSGAHSMHVILGYLQFHNTSIPRRNTH